MNYMNKSLSIRETLSLSWQEIQARFLPFLLLALSISFSNWLCRGIFLGFDPLLMQAAQQQHPILSIFSHVLSGLFSMWLTIAFVFYVCKRTNSTKELLWLALMRLPRLLIGTILYTVPILFFMLIVALLCTLLFLLGNPVTVLLAVFVALVGFIALIAWFVYFILLPYVFILTDLPFMASFRYAYSLVKNRFWHTVGLLALVTLIITVVSVILFIGIGLIGVVLWMVIPSSRYIIGLLAILPMALVYVIYQVTFIAVYIDSTSRANLPQEEPQEETLPTLN